MEPIRWARIVAVLIVLVAIVEVGSRAFSWAWAGQPYRSFAKYRWSPYGLMRNNPELTMPGFHINRNGFRNPRDYTREKPANTLRVLMLGGSVLYSGLAGQMVRGAVRIDSTSTIAQYLEAELRADPELAGLEIEVLNAAVNFNQIPEVSTSYLTEYAFWNPDVVVILGSANNFAVRAWSGDIVARRHGMQAPHPWWLEFERIANERSFFAFVEHAMTYAESNLASAAWAKKAGTAVVDKLFAMAEVRSLRRRPATLPRRASWAEFDDYVSEYLGYVDAMIAVAQRRGQSIAFFWEYYLEHIKGLKPLSSAEQELYDRIVRKTHDLDAEFNFYARDRIGSYLRQRGIPFLDPLDALRVESDTVFIDYLHYTREGNALMARFIHDQLRDLFYARARSLRRAD